MTRKSEGYEVGRGKPPRETRFAKGKSGNPKGRPKGARNFAKDVEEVLNAMVTVMKDGRPRKVSSQLGTLMRLREKALKGDPRAMERFLELALQNSLEKAAASAERSLSAGEEEILRRHVEAQNARNDPDDPDQGSDDDGR